MVLKFDSAIHLYISVSFIQTFYNLLVTIQEFPSDDDVETKSPRAHSDSNNYISEENMTLSQIHMYNGGFHELNNEKLHNVSHHRRSVLTIGASLPAENESPFPFNIEHKRTNILYYSDKVGFSIKNLTGQPMRYLQQWDDGTKTIQYLEDKERGLLNFVPCNTIIRNYERVEETFDVQMDLNNSARSRKKTKVVGNRVSVQVAGYKWLYTVQAEELGITHADLKPVLGRKFLKNIYNRDPKIEKATKLVTEVVPHCGGRMLILRSVFTIKNNTKHCVRLLAIDEKVNTKENSASNDEKLSFIVDSNSNFNVPLCLMRRTALATNGQSLGLLYISPTDIAPIEEELGGRPHFQPGSVDYSTDPIDLYKTMDFVNQQYNNEGGEGDNVRTAKSKNKIIQIVCNINVKDNVKGTGTNAPANSKLITGSRDKNDNKKAVFNSGADKFPPFCYNIEVLHHSEKKYDYSNGFQLRSLFAGNIFGPSKNTSAGSQLQYTIGTLFYFIIA